MSMFQRVVIDLPSGQLWPDGTVSAGACPGGTSSQGLLSSWSGIPVGRLDYDPGGAGAVWVVARSIAQGECLKACPTHINA